MSLKSFLFVIFSILSLQSNALTFMSYNVENLFDVKDDKGKNDEAYLPLKHPAKSACKKVQNKYYRGQCEKTDWTQGKLDQKLTNIKQVVESYPHKLDLLSVIEVENDKVLAALGKTLGMEKFISTHSPDERGVDVALFYRPSNELKWIKTEELELKEGLKKPTRNILIGYFKYQKRDLIVLVNHWPSQGAPTKVRVAVAKEVREKLLALKKSFPKAWVIATGDFNTLDKEYPAPFDELQRDQLLIDTRQYLESKSIQGSYFYVKHMSWNLLDRFFISENLNSSKKKIEFKIWNPNFATGVFEYTYKDSAFFGSRIVGLPKRFDHQAKNLKRMGYSDHFPVVLEIGK